MEQTKIYVVLVHEWGTSGLENDHAEIYGDKFFTNEQSAIDLAKSYAQNLIKEEDWVRDIHETYHEDWDDTCGSYEWRDINDGHGMSINVTELSNDNK